MMPPHFSSSRRRTALAMILCAGLLAGASGSSTSGSADLVRLSERETQRQDDRAMLAPPPPGVDAESIAPINATDPKAQIITE